MPAQIMDGRKLAEKIKLELRSEIRKIKDAGKREPCLAVVLVGQNPASQLYVKNKEDACSYVGIKSLVYKLPENTSEQDLLEQLDKIGDDYGINGLLVQLPLPKTINKNNIIKKISIKKDVDCFNPYNVGKLFLGIPHFTPCTPSGIIELLNEYNIDLAGKNITIIGRSDLVSKPLANLFLTRDATVTICHSKTNNLKERCLPADIIVSAAGSPNLIEASFVKEGAVLIDVGINRLSDGKFVGDINYDSCFKKASFITTVPGGVGPMTVAMLLKNCFQAYLEQN